MRLGDIGQVFDGPHATPRRTTEGPYYLNISSLNNGRLNLAESDHIDPDEYREWTRRVVPQAGDLLFSYETRLGEAALMPANLDACLGRRMALIRPNRTIANPRFLLYWYLSPTMQEMIQRNRLYGATVDRIPLGEMPGWAIQIPPLKEQESIADVLGALDDKIAANARIETTLSDAGRLFFELARSEASSLVPVPTAIKITFGEPFIGELFNSIQIGRPLLRIRDIGQRRCDVWTTEVRDRETLIRPGDAVAGMDADFSPAIWLGEPSLLNQRVCHISSHDLGTAFALEIARSGFTQIQNEKSGTTVIHLNKSDLERTSVYLPNGPSAQRLASSADEARRTLVAIAEESRTLEELRDTLLPALMDGRIRVKDAVRTAEEAL